ncbi:hypothetical protein ES319_A11G157100v1 [Gossypium barbadense]|uniref:Protein FAR1-RELATED SEQUENCE n=1 Tax=Gossypium barbadense TaxID=3634 RepID=A0A5J5TNT8_GOSBA|nr:hypothetical protein ES319_A11G157100v1 [Gossypium barbadense]
MSNFNRSKLNEGNEISMVTSPFFTDRVFESHEELMQWVENTPFSLGYIIVTRRSKAKENGVVICDQHNYPPAQHMEGHAYARRLKENEKKLLVDLTSKNVTPRDILSTLKEQDENNVSTLKTIYNARQKLRSSQNVGTVGMSKEVIDQNEPMQTRRRGRKASRSRHMLSALEDQVGNLEESVGNMKETLELVEGRTDGFDSMEEQLRDFVLDSLGANAEKLNELVNSTTKKLAERDENLEDMMLAMKKEIEELKGELTIYKAALSNGMLSSKPKQQAIDVPKPEKFKGARSARDIVKSQLTSIYESFENNRIILKHRHNLPCFRLLRGFVALEALDILEGELQRSSKHQLDSSNCGCKLRHSCGLPCVCMLSVYLNSGECIPLDSIDIFWRKLDLSPSTSVKNEDICCDSELEMFKENFTKQSKAGKKKQQQKRVNSISQAPRRRSHSTTSKSVGSDLVELNKEPARHSSYMPESCDTHPLMKEIPNMFLPYITHVQDVKGDGNYGFRAIPVCLGYGEDQWLYVRHQLLDELLSSYDVYARVFTDRIDELRSSLCFSQSPVPAEHWMIMPMTGVLIVNRFRVILNYLTKRCDITFFPRWRGPEHFQYHHAITIAHVYDNHNVMVQLEGDYPMPTILAYWICHRAPQLKPCNLKTPVITIEDYC